MQKVSINNLAEGMTTYTRLCTADGRVLLGSRIRLSASYIKKIHNLGVLNLFVTNPIIERIGLVYEETLPEDKRTEAIRILKTSFDNAKEGKLIDVHSIYIMAKTIIETVKSNQLIRLDTTVTADDYVYSHCINVAALAAVIASDMEYNSAKMQELVMGALLHDIGKVLDNGNVSEEDHPHKGFEYARKLRDYSIVASHVIYQHHEKVDGTGYPRGISGEQLHEYARITAVADAYDTIVSDFPKGQALLPHQAYEAIMSMSGTYLDKEIADIFLAKAPLYPLGTFVVLDSGFIGVVTEARPKLQARPTITVITDAQAIFQAEWVEIELAKNLTSFINHVMSEKEVLALTKKYENRSSHRR
ncbi:HD-GYP domain-containing protein [Sporomusa sp.]|uniref:HD-GYP domain-containing protein n=1 Tax=Sporomusa sp. TaxID=2078658 RepID=UPI002B7BB765|nr:HD domain-containing phosphohydrolase [Sporomusa sp.]HWR09865.1 HD domain-containing phosphohydrolase [Sporomusa sp.]